MKLNIRGLLKANRFSSIRARLSLFLVLLVASMSLIIFSTQTASYRYIDEFRDDLQSHYRINALLVAIRADFHALENALRSSSEPNIDQEREGLLSLQADLSRVASESATSIEAWFEINALENAFAAYSAREVAALQGYREGTDSYYQDFIAAQRIEAYMETYLANLQTIRLSQGGIYYNSLAAQAKNERLLVIYSIVAATLLTIRFTLYFSRRFTEPIRALADLSSRIAAGELDVPTVAPGGHERDEIGTLTASFDLMSRNIRSLVADLESKSALEKQLHEEELEKESTMRALREAELINLQTQIKPHFFFNAVNTITRQAELEHAENTAALVRSLANLFRYSLVGHQRTVPLEQELLAVREYTGLQRRRFGDRMTFSVTVEEGLPATRIPPLIVLPFVENAVCHGLEPKISGGRLRIDVKKRRGGIAIRVADNGAGMEGYDFSNLEGDTLMGGTTEGIGIKNVIRRMKLYYGEAASVRLFSKPHRGTLAVITVPAGEP